MGHKPNGYTAPLDTRIASTLASDEVDKTALTLLLEEAHEALSLTRNVIVAETPRLHDLNNTDPDKSLDLINRSKLRVERLELAIPKLRDRLNSIAAYEYREAWHSDADVVDIRIGLSATRLKHYAKFLTWLEAEFAEIDDINAEIGALHARAPAGEQRRLTEPELLARGLTNYDREHPRLREQLKLPDFIRADTIAFPPDPMQTWNARAAQSHEAMRQRMAEKGALTTGPDWAAGRDLAVQQEEAEHAQRDAELRAKDATAKVEYERRLQDTERRRLGGVK